MLLNFFKDSASVLQSLDKLEQTCVEIADEFKKAHKKGNSILLAGNGGSCSDSLHFAGELSCTYARVDRKPFRAICLQANQASLTAWSNDFDFTSFYQRQIEAIGRKGDILVLFSTSGGCLKTKRSLNLILAANEAKRRGIKVVGFLGKSGGELISLADIILLVRSDSTAMVQQAHITLVHAICELLER
tara:strand:- start:21 stop:587 length:567 start_codon:yes stop_codon:yes gene_type:complete